MANMVPISKIGPRERPDMISVVMGGLGSAGSQARCDQSGRGAAAIHQAVPGSLADRL